MMMISMDGMWMAALFKSRDSPAAKQVSVKEINLLAPELFFKCYHTLYIKCE